MAHSRPSHNSRSAERSLKRRIAIGQRFVSWLLLILLVCAGGLSFSMQKSSANDVNAQVIQEAEVAAESEDVDSEGRRNKLERMMRKARQRLASLTPNEIQDIAGNSNKTVKLRPERDGKDCKKDKKGKNKKDCKNGKDNVGQEQAVKCELGPDNPHRSSSTGGATVNVHLSVQCPVPVAAAVLVGGLQRDIVQGIASNQELHTHIPTGKKRETFVFADCIGGSHLYTAVQVTYIEAPGYMQVDGFATASSANISNC